ncbi:TPA: Lrp/AsnC family transcriptional regulator [Candidatus Woesearchaeota archaeon]|nr:Lrp/AsnC family transcriptional regulator [Candidatus Woesearchaeota archaeon]
MLCKKDLIIISYLRRNARQSLTSISKKTSIPISTIYDRLRIHYGNVILRHTSLIDFSKLGFTAKANIALRVDSEEREALKMLLMKSHNINSIYKMNNGFDFLAEGLFKNIQEVDSFMELLESRFRIRDKEVYYIVGDIKREGFLSDPQIVGAMGEM